MGYITGIIRKERESLKQKGWILLYGRRKAGKTYLLRNLYSPDVYILVKKDRALWSEDIDVDISSVSEKVRKLLEKGKKVVIDEFQRMDQSVLEEIVTVHPKGKLMLSGSSLRVVNQILSQDSPLLGFFSPLKIGLISTADMLRNLSQKFKPQRTVELSTFLRDPWLVPFYSGEKTERFLFRIMTQFRDTIPSLIGETFTEEEREITEVYGAVLSLIGAGTWKAKDISSILYNRNVIKEPGSSSIIQYTKNMREMDLLETYRIYGSKMKYNRLKSPIMNLYYYLDSRYNISERKTSFKEVKPTLDNLINLEIQNFSADVFAGIYDGRKEYFLSPDKEIDFVITRRNKPVCVGEVKWCQIRNKHVKRFKQNTERFSCDKVVIGKKSSEKLEKRYPEITFYTPEDLIQKMVKNK